MRATPAKRAWGIPAINAHLARTQYLAYFNPECQRSCIIER